jgi:poly(3-hydroxybutyrate) depolymerase
METATMGEAILIAMEPGLYNAAHYNSATCAKNMSCQYCFDDGADATTANSVEYPYFEALHQAVEASTCVDKNRQFYAGYSSGGWMAQQLGCRYPDVLRAQGSVTGGLPPVIKNGTETCVDHPIAAFLIHDYNDTSNVYAGSVAALERLLKLNHCAGGKTMATATKAPYMIAGIANTASFSCLRYTGCPADYPIVFCTSTGQAHGSQSPSAVPGFWGFFSTF